MKKDVIKNFIEAFSEELKRHEPEKLLAGLVSEKLEEMVNKTTVRDFKVGDVVRFKSGGIWMTVHNIVLTGEGETLIQTVYSNEDGKIISSKPMPPEILELAKDES